MGEHIRELRIARGLSLRRFALMVGLDKTHLSHIERGKVDLRLSSFDKILCGLDISAEDFFADLKDV